MFKHTLLTWLSTGIVGSLILSLILGLTYGFGVNDVGLILLVAFVYVMILSIPAMIFYGFLVRSLVRRFRLSKAKALCSVYALLATELSCLLFCWIPNGEFLKDTGAVLLLSLCFAVCFAATPWMIPIPVPAHLNIPERSKPETPAVQISPTTSYYLVVGISCIALLGRLVTLLTNGSQATIASVLLTIAYLAFGGFGVWLFSEWKSAGWKILVVISASGVAGTLMSLLQIFIFMASVEYRMENSFYLVVPLVLAVLDCVALYLLLRRDFRLYFETTKQDCAIWTLAGAGYAALQFSVSFYL